MRERLELNLAAIRNRIDQACSRRRINAGAVTLVAVTKSVPVRVIKLLYDLGLRDFGENRPQSLWERAPQLPADCRWHMIGQVQTNKLKKTLPFIHLLHSLDRMSLVKALRVETAKIAEPITALVELNLTGETAKHGFREDELASVWQEIEAVPNVHVKGFMAMAKLDATTQECRATFAKLREIRDQYARHSRPSHSLDLLSMGMSDDFEVAIEEGATHVRIGSALFEGLPND